MIGTFKNQQRQQRSETVLQMLRDAKPGEVVTYDAIEAAIGVPYSRGRNEEFRAAVNSARNRFRSKEFGGVTRCVLGVGVRVATPIMKFTDCYVERQKKSARQQHKTVAEMQTVDTTGLSDHLRKTYAARMRYAYDTRRELRREVRNSDKSVKSPTNPRRPSANN